MKKISLFLMSSIFCVSSYGQLYFKGIPVEGKPSEVRLNFESKNIKLKKILTNGDLIYETTYYGKNVTLTVHSDGDKDKGHFEIQTNISNDPKEVSQLYEYFKDKFIEIYGETEECQNYLRENEKNKNAIMNISGSDLKSSSWEFDGYGIDLQIEENGFIKINLYNSNHALKMEEGYTDPKDI
jgi:hypothetical protein